MEQPITRPTQPAVVIPGSLITEKETKGGSYMDLITKTPNLDEPKLNDDPCCIYYCDVIDIRLSPVNRNTSAFTAVLTVILTLVLNGRSVSLTI